MKPEVFYKRFGNEIPADDFHNTSTAWHYGGAWIVYTLNEDGTKNVATQSLDPVYGIWWINRLRSLQQG